MFCISMLAIVFLFANDLLKSRQKHSSWTKRVDAYRVQAVLEEKRNREERQRARKRINNNSALPNTSIAAVPPPVPVPSRSKIEIDAGLIKIAMENEASWNAIFKIIFSLLFTFLGVKLINHTFKRLEAA